MGNHHGILRSEVGGKHIDEITDICREGSANLHILVYWREWEKERDLNDGF